jgi:hypothetical protein
MRRQVGVPGAQVAIEQPDQSALKGEKKGCKLLTRLGTMSGRSRFLHTMFDCELRRIG